MSGKPFVRSAVLGVAALGLSGVMLAAQEPAPAATAPEVSAPRPARWFGLPDHILGDLVAAFAFGLVVILLCVLGYKGIDWALRGVDFDRELAKGNVAVGIVCAGIILGICYAVSSVVVAIIR